MGSNDNKTNDNLKSKKSNRSSFRKHSQQIRKPKSNEGKKDRGQDLGSLEKDSQTISNNNNNMNKKTSNTKIKNKKKDSYPIKGKNNKDIDNKKKRKQSNNTSNSNDDYKRQPSNDMKKNTQNKNNKQSQEESSTKSCVNTNKKKSNNNSSGKRRRRNRNKDLDTTKFRIVVRLLPPNLYETSFLTEIEKSFSNDNFIKEYQIVDYYFVQGHYPIKAFNEPTYSRAYFTFLNMEQLVAFVEKISNIVFVDDRDTAMKPRIRMTPYVKTLSRDNDIATEIKNLSKNENDEIQKSIKKNGKNGRSLEGTLNNDKIYQTFLKSLSILETTENSDYLFDGSISLLRPLNKELIRQKRVNEGIEKKRENALIELAGALKKDKKSDKSKKNKDKNKKKDDSLDDQNSKKKRKRKKKKAKSKNSCIGLEDKSHSKDKSVQQNKKENNNNNNNNNIVILEAAGKRELQKRMKLQKQKELEKKREVAKAEQNNNVTISKFNINSQPFIPASMNKTSKMIPSQITLLKREGAT